MLERATECLESAGQRLLRHSGNVVRSRRALRPRFWHHGELDIPAWCFLFVQSAWRAPGGRNPYRRARTPTEDRPCDLYLDFLYPSYTGNLAKSCSQPRKHDLARKKRKLPGSSSRTYVSSTSKLFQGTGDYNSCTSTLPSEVDSSQGTSSQHNNLDESGTPSQQLSAILNSRDPERRYDEVWDLYRSIEYNKDKEDYTFRVLSYIGNSPRKIDVERAKDILQETPINARTHTHYYTVVKTLLHTRHSADLVKEIVREAISQDKGRLSWNLAFAHSVNAMQWTDMCDLWQFKPPDVAPGQLDSCLAELDGVAKFPNRVIQLTDAMGAGMVSLGEPVHVPKFLLHQIFSSTTMMKHISMKKILNLTQNFNNLGLLDPEHYFAAIATFSTLDIPSAASRSILTYRNFCWRMTSRPSRNVLYNLVNVSCQWEDPDHVKFAVDEYRFFYGTLPRKLYRFALTALAKVGDVLGVDRIFSWLLRKYWNEEDQPGDRDHGGIKHPKFYVPYIYVYAKLGLVDETRARLENLRLFHVIPNVYCWNVLLTAHANAADFSGAFSLFDSMVPKGLFNSHTIGILMGMCAKRGDTDTINALFEVAMDKDIPITVPLIDAAVESCLKNQKFEDAEKIAEAAVKTEYKGSITRMWNMLIVHYAYAYDVNSVTRIHERMKDLGIPQDGSTCSALMLALAMVGKTNMARELLQELHQSSKVHATEFHYSILLHGYVRERNRDMVNVIYHEIKDRFDNPGFSSKLAVLEAAVQRDLQLHHERGGARTDHNIKLAHAEQFFGTALRESDVLTDVSERPRSGLSLRKAYPAAYYEYMISAYGTNGAFQRVDSLLSQYDAGKTTDDHPIRLLSTLMLVHIKREQYDQVCACWNMAFPRVARLACRPDMGALLLQKHRQSSPSPPSPHPVQPAIAASIAASASTTSNDNPSLVCHAYRFVLSRCISYYIQALAFQNLHSKIPDVMSDIEDKGFSLSTQNWSMYVKMLASSGTPENQFRAFTLFEKKFMPNFPGWKYFRRGYGLEPGGAPTLRILETKPPGGNKKSPRLDGRIARRIRANIQPDFMQPTYITMMYLASALLDYRDRSIVDGGSELRSLYEAAPKTFIAITEMPYLRDKFQGVLLRGRPIQESPPQPIRFNDKFIFTGGVLGPDGPRFDASPENLAPEEMWMDSDHDEGGQLDEAEDFDMENYVGDMMELLPSDSEE